MAPTGTIFRTPGLECCIVPEIQKTDFTGKVGVNRVLICHTAVCAWLTVPPVVDILRIGEGYVQFSASDI